MPNLDNKTLISDFLRLPREPLVKLARQRLSSPVLSSLHSPTDDLDHLRSMNFNHFHRFRNRDDELLGDPYRPQQSIRYYSGARERTDARARI